VHLFNVALAAFAAFVIVGYTWWFYLPFYRYFTGYVTSLKKTLNVSILLAKAYNAKSTHSVNPIET